MFCACTFALSQYMCSAQYGCFFVVPLPRAFPVCCSDIVWVIMKWFQSPLITVITFAFIFHMRWISVMRFLYFKISSDSFLITFLSPGIATSIDMHVPCLLSRIMMPVLLLGIVLSVRTCWFHSMVTLPHDLFRLILVHGHTSVCCLILPLFTLRMWKCS